MSALPDAGPARPADGRGGPLRDLAVALLVATTASLPAFLVGTLAVQIRASLGVGAAALGAIVAGYYLCAAISSVPGGHAAERIGGIRVMRLTAIAGAALLVGAGLLTRSMWLLTVLIACSGAVAGASSPATNLFLVRRIPAGWQGAAFGIKQAAVPLANLLGGLAVPVVALTIGWRWAFVLAALFAAATAASVPRARTPLAQRRSGRTPPVSLPPLVFLAAGLGLGMFAASGLTAFAVLAAVRVGFSNGTAGLLAALGGATAVVARVLIGFYADRSRRDRFAVAALMITPGAAGFIALAVAMSTGSRWLFIAGLVVALGVGWGWNGLFNYGVVASYRSAPAKATAITQIGGRLGSVLGPFAVGVVVQQVSYQAAWLTAAAAALAAAAAVATGMRLLGRSSREPR